jgi:hypothetical protein
MYDGVSGRNGNCYATLAACNALMDFSRDRTATIPLGTLPPRSRSGVPETRGDQAASPKPRLRCVGCGWEADATRPLVALEPGMLRTVLPWILAPWAVLALVAWALLI